MYRAALVIGLICLGAAAVVVLADSSKLSQSMPTQVLPRRMAWYPAALGAVLVVVGGVGLLLG